MSRRDEETLLIVEADPAIRRSLMNYLKADYRILGAITGVALASPFIGESLSARSDTWSEEF